jgi:hypothetical protein
MKTANEELTFDRLDQVSGGYRDPRWLLGRVWADATPGRYLPPNKNNDVRPFLT